MKYSDFQSVELLSGKEMYDELSSSINADMQTRLKYYNSREGINELHFVVRAGEKIVAIAGIQENPYNPKQLWSKHFSVDAEYRNLGLASKLIDSVFEYALKNHYVLVRSSSSEMGTEYLKHVIEKAKRKYPTLEVIDSQT